MSETAYCRLCAELRPVANLVPIIGNEGSQINYKIFHCFQISIGISDEDKLPKCICSVCYEQVSVTYDFSEKIHKAQEFLRNLFIDNKNIKVEWNYAFDGMQNESELNNSIKSEENTNNYDEEYNLLDYSSPKNESDLDELMLSDRLRINNLLERKVRRKKSLKNKAKTDSSKLEFKNRLKEILKEWKNYKWRCSQCEFVEFSTVKELRAHFNGEHTEMTIQYMCMECSKMYTKYDLFKRHVRTHRNKHKYRCDDCGKFSYNKSIHEQHMVKHSEIKKFMCSQCGKSFKTQSSLRIHGRIHLPDEQKFSHTCDICNKKFSTAPNLILHKKIHSGTKQYTCDQCGFNFTQKVNLKNHIISKHTIDTPCQCKLCPKVFKNIFRLRRHELIHSDLRPYECDVCSKRYIRGSDLRVHKRIHSGELPYPCEYCNKRFRMRKFLQVHIRQHTGERPYSCLDCNHHFANSSNYIKHMKAKHGVSSFKNLTNRSLTKEKLSQLEQNIFQVIKKDDC